MNWKRFDFLYCVYPELKKTIDKAPIMPYTLDKRRNVTYRGANEKTNSWTFNQRLCNGGSDLAMFAKGADFKGGKDFTRASGADIKNYVEGLLK